MDDIVKRVAAAIRNEIQLLLSDYVGNVILSEDAPLGAIAGLEFLQRTWTEEAPAAEERLEVAARAAIKAMREPTDEMAAAFYALDEAGAPTSAHDGWRAMIDAALKPNTSNSPSAGAGDG